MRALAVRVESAKHGEAAFDPSCAYGRIWPRTSPSRAHRVHVDIKIARLCRVLRRESFAPAGTAQLSLPSFTSGMMTPPFLPLAASWMWAAVALMPVVVTLPDTVPSSPI
jgi:hypothetical protein